MQLPPIGLGVFQTPPDETLTAVQPALSAGYRHIDTAAAYGNEKQVGEALVSSAVDRSEVFVETKLWISDYSYGETLHGFEKSAAKLDQLVGHRGTTVTELVYRHQLKPVVQTRATAGPALWRWTSSLALDQLFGADRGRA
jgi:diketogulonate reductase-like aldo/keto reductase